MRNIRKARIDDLSRAAEIFVFNNRINYFPIFKDEGFSFGELQVVSLVDNYFKKDDIIKNMYIFDDGLVKGFLQMNETEICKLYVDTFFQNEGIGGELVEYAVQELHADHLWALEKNARAITFYQRHGFYVTDQKKFEEDTTEYLVKLVRMKS
ncbi:MAG: GNAT family N-acetyltransferase [Dorea sp.]|nr:GNAT family N-acetyltransferase [Dorea sp.]